MLLLCCCSWRVGKSAGRLNFAGSGMETTGIGEEEVKDTLTRDVTNGRAGSVLISLGAGFVHLLSIFQGCTILGFTSALLVVEETVGIMLEIFLSTFTFLGDLFSLDFVSKKFLVNDFFQCFGCFETTGHFSTFSSSYSCFFSFLTRHKGLLSSHTLTKCGETETDGEMAA